MALTLITFTGKGGELTYDDMDNNWAAIMDAVNSMGAQQLYQVMDLNGVNACQDDGTNVITVSCKVKILQAYNINPVLRYTVTLNGVIVSAEQVSGYFTGQIFPFAQNTEGGELLNIQIQIQANQYPAIVKVYLLDESQNYAQPVSLVIENNPCAIPAEVLTLTTSHRIAGNLVITGDIENGSNDYAVQYNNGGNWTNIGTWTQVDGAVNQSFATVLNGMYEVRIIDTLSNNVSNQINTDF